MALFIILVHAGIGQTSILAISSNVLMVRKITWTEKFTNKEVNPTHINEELTEKRDQFRKLLEVFSVFYLNTLQYIIIRLENYYRCSGS